MLKIGADPELFLYSEEIKEYVSAHGYINGDKDNPQRVPGGAIQVDGMAMEFNIDPAETMEQFQDRIEQVQKHLLEKIYLRAPHTLKLHTVPSVIFSDKIIKTTHPNALILGCVPDFNAWNDGLENEKPNESSSMRTAAGHIHLGWIDNEDDYVFPFEEKHFSRCIESVKQMDASLGVQSLLWDDDTRRREMYGKAGAFRPKMYGVEYRTLSNAWLKSKDLVGHVFNTAHKAMDDLMKGIKYFEDFDPETIINSGDKEAAKKVVENLHNKFGVVHV